MDTQKISLTDAIFRIIEKASSIEDCQALLNYLLALGVTSRTHKPACTIGYASKALKMGEKRIRRAFHDLEAMKLIKPDVRSNIVYVELEFHSFDLANILRDANSGKGCPNQPGVAKMDTPIGVADSDTPGVAKMATHTCTTRTYITKEDEKEKERELTDRNEIQDPTAPTVSLQETGDAARLAPQEISEGGQLSPHNVGEVKQNGLCADVPKGISREEVKENLLKLWNCDQEVAEAWIRYREIYCRTNYFKISHRLMMHYALIRARNGFSSNEVDLARLCQIFKPKEDITDASELVDRLIRNGFSIQDKLPILQALSSYCELKDILKTNAKDLQELNFKALGFLSEMPSTSKPNIKQIVEVCRIYKSLMETGSSLGEFIEWHREQSLERGYEGMIHFGHYTSLKMVDSYMADKADLFRERREDCLEEKKKLRLLEIVKEMVEKTKDVEVVDCMKRMLEYRISYGNARNFVKQKAVSYNLPDSVQQIEALANLTIEEGELQLSA